MNDAASPAFPIILPYEKPRPFILEEAICFANQCYFQIPIQMLTAEFMPQSMDICCIDDRHEDNGATFPFPGASLGLYATLLAGLNRACQNSDVELTIGAVRVFQMAFEEVCGPCSCHTDDSPEARAPGARICQGCGHIARTLRSPEKYGLTPWLATELDRYIASLDGRGPAVPVYKGGHRARGVFIVDKVNIGLRSRSPATGDQAYVYNPEWYLRTARRVASTIYFKVLIGLVPTVNLHTFQRSLVLDSAMTNLGHTVEDLAPDLPKFMVFHDRLGKLKVEQVGMN